MSQCLIAANWKLNGDWQLCQRFIELQPLLSAKPVRVVLCPPAVYVQKLSDSLHSAAASEVAQNMLVGAQNTAAQRSGAYTGELSAAMLADVGARYCIVGHSERRADFAETDQDVALKSAHLIAAGVTPIICVGEDLAQREAGQALTVIESQLLALADILKDVSADIVIAYEPIWAIGTGVTATPEQAQAVHAFIRGKLAEKSPFCADNCRVLYGGSVNASNAETLLSERDIDGALVGGASLDVDAFLQIVTSSRSRAG